MNIENLKQELSPQVENYIRVLGAEKLYYLGIRKVGADDCVVFKANDREWHDSMFLPVKDFNIKNIRIKVKEMEEKFNKAN